MLPTFAYSGAWCLVDGARVIALRSGDVIEVRLNGWTVRALLIISFATVRRALSPEQASPQSSAKRFRGNIKFLSHS